VLADGLGGLLSALFTVTPLSIFAQVCIVSFQWLGGDVDSTAEQRCDRDHEVCEPDGGALVLLVPHRVRRSRQGFRRLPGQYVCSVPAHAGTDARPVVPNPVLGGVTTFLFASVVTSGVRVLGYVRFTRRDRFILAAALSFGLGDILAPTVFTHLFDGVKTTNKGVQGLMSSVTIVLSTPCECAAVVGRLED
jgi:hypothetical protein